MNSRERFLAACRREPVDRAPVWIMRQAGRALPEYRKLREKYSFKTLVKTPELACEVTLQPIKRFDFDAAIIFSDILVIPEALGFPYQYDDARGMRMARRLSKPRRLKQTMSLGFAEESLRLVRRELPDKALIGFGGSPWTLAHFMAEGKLKQWFYEDRASFNTLMDSLADAVIIFFRAQIRAGVDALQIFDSLGGAIPAADYEEASLRWIRKIVRTIDVPVIVYARGVHDWKMLVSSEADVIAVDSGVRLGAAPKTIAVQGNLDPEILTLDRKIVRRETKKLLAEMTGRRGHILNLGHGLLPASKLDCIEEFVATSRL